MRSWSVDTISWEKEEGGIEGWRGAAHVQINLLQIISRWLAYSGRRIHKNRGGARSVILLLIDTTTVCSPPCPTCSFNVQSRTDFIWLFEIPLSPLHLSAIQKCRPPFHLLLKCVCRLRRSWGVYLWWYKRGQLCRHQKRNGCWASSSLDSDSSQFFFFSRCLCWFSPSRSISDLLVLLLCMSSV